MKIKHVILGAAIGIAAGVMLGQVPQVKNAVCTCKKKIKKMLKSDDD